MVLAELGKKITGALRKLNQQVVVDQKVLNECLHEICMALLQADVNVKFVHKMRQNISNRLKKQEGLNLRKIIKVQVIKQLTQMLTIERKPYAHKKGKANVVMMVGLQGSGKTTTCAKYAYYYQQKGWKVCLVCCDTFRAGAFDQLKQNSCKIRVPFFGKQSEHDPVLVAEEGVNLFKKEGFEIIIVDTSGKHKQQAALFEQMKQIEEVIKPNQIIFVMDSLIGQQCYAQAEAFKKAVQIGSIIITKIDGHAKGGGALSAVAATQSPIVFVGKGQHFTDLQPFQASNFIRNLLGQGNIKKILEEVKTVVTPQTQAQLIQKVKKGEFTFRDLKGQFSSCLKLGSISNFIGMLPGVGSDLINKTNQQESINRIKRFIYILDSMTAQQLDSKVQINESRVKRLARGSGTSIQQVMMLVEQHKRLKIMIQKASNNGLLKNGKMI